VDGIYLAVLGEKIILQLVAPRNWGSEIFGKKLLDSRDGICFREILNKLIMYLKYKINFL